MQATFTPQFVNPPRGNARSASIKDTDGGYWGIHPGDMNKYQVGVPVTVEYVQNGKYFNVKGIVGQQAPANPQAQLRQLTPQERQIARDPYNKAPTNPQADPRKSEDIFVCGVVNHAIAHQSYMLGSDELRKLIMMARWAWRNGEPIYERPMDAPFPGSPDDNWEPDPRG